MNHVDCQFIKFLLKSRETVSRDSKTTETIQYTVIYDRSKLDLIGESSKINIGSLSIVSTTQADSTIANMTWTVKLNKLPNGSKSREFSFSSCINITNTDDRFTKLMGDIKQHILIELEFLKKSQLLKQQKQSESTKQHHPLMSQDDYFGDKTDSLIDVIAEHTTGRSIQIKNIYYSSNDPQHGEPTPVYEIEVRHPDDVHSYIKTILLHVTVYYDAEKQQFYASINTVRINGIFIDNKLIFDPAIKYLKLSSVYAYDQLNHIDFKEAIEEYLKSVSSWLDLCNKILNSKSETE